MSTGLLMEIDNSLGTQGVQANACLVLVISMSKFYLIWFSDFCL